MKSFKWEVVVVVVVVVGIIIILPSRQVMLGSEVSFKSNIHNIITHSIRRFVHYSVLYSVLLCPQRSPACL